MQWNGNWESVMEILWSGFMDFNVDQHDRVYIVMSDTLSILIFM